MLSKWDHPDGFRTFEFSDGTHTVSGAGQWLDGEFESHEAALRSGRQQVGLDPEPTDTEGRR